MAQTLREKYALLQAAKKAGKEAADIATDAQSLTHEIKKELREWSKNDLETEELLDRSVSAEEQIAGEAFAKREYLRTFIAQRLHPDSTPGEVIQYIEESMADTLPRGGHAIPLFREVSLFEGSQHPLRLHFPQRKRTKSGGWLIEGGKFLIPQSPEDAGALRILLELRPIMQEAILSMVSSEMFLADLNFIVGWASAFFDHLLVLPAPYIERGYECIGENPRMFRPRSIPNQGQRRTYVGYPLPTGETLLILDTPVGRKLVEGLKATHEDYIAFWNNEYDIPYMIQDVIDKYADMVVDPVDLLNGLPGVCACSYDLQDPKQKIYVFVERRVSDGQWRCVMTNPEGITFLFGKEYTDYLVWTNVPIGHDLAHVLREGQIIHPTKRAAEEHGLLATVTPPPKITHQDTEKKEV